MDSVVRFIYDNGLIAMFLIILLEYGCFPISSEIVLPFSGAVASLQNISFFLMLPVSVCAGIIGTSFCYFVGRIGGHRILEKITTKFPKTKKSIDASYQRFDRYGSYVVCFGRMVPIIRTYIAFVAGAVKQPYPVFALFSIIGITLWNSLLIGIGYILRGNWSNTVTYYAKYKDILIPVLLLVILFLIARKIRKNKRMQEINVKTEETFK